MGAAVGATCMEDGKATPSKAQILVCMFLIIGCRCPRREWRTVRQDYVTGCVATGTSGGAVWVISNRRDGSVSQAETAIYHSNAQSPSDENGNTR